MREGDVFGRVCLFTEESPGRVETCSYMGLLPSTHMGTPPDVLKLAHHVAHTSIGKRVVGLRLKGLATSAFFPHC